MASRFAADSALRRHVAGPDEAFSRRYISQGLEARIPFVPHVAGFGPFSADLPDKGSDPIYLMQCSVL